VTRLQRVVAITVPLLFGCDDTRPQPERFSEQQRIEALSAEVVRLGRMDLPDADCGPPPVAGENVVVFATADLCLSCLEVGRLLRDIARQGIPAQEAVVVTPAAHSREVCDYLRREKVRWRVVGIAEERLPEAHTPRAIVYFELQADGRTRRREHAPTPLDLAAIILPRPGAGAPGHPDPEIIE
jgi:hypothetical protein